MTDEMRQKCETLAKWCGWIHIFGMSHSVWLTSNGYPTDSPPKYFSDMNACLRDFDQKLQEELGKDYEIRFIRTHTGFECIVAPASYGNTIICYIATGSTMPDALANACLKLAKGEKP